MYYRPYQTEICGKIYVCDGKISRNSKVYHDSKLYRKQLKEDMNISAHMYRGGRTIYLNLLSKISPYYIFPALIDNNILVPRVCRYAPESWIVLWSQISPHWKIHIFRVFPRFIITENPTTTFVHLHIGLTIRLPKDHSKLRAIQD